MLCVLIMVGLWSTVYGLPRSTPPYDIDSIELPCSEELWTSKSAQQWRALSPKFRTRPRLQERLDALLAGKTHPCAGFPALCLIAGLLIYADELRNSSATSAEDLNESVKQAAHAWAAGYCPDWKENLSATVLALTTANYLRMSLVTNLRAAMACFVRRDFDSMREKLREGNLRDAGHEALMGLRHWLTCANPRMNMTLLPSGKTPIDQTQRLDSDFLMTAIVVTEYSVTLTDRPRSRGSDPTWSSMLRSALDLPRNNNLCPREVWSSCRRTIEKNTSRPPILHMWTTS